MPATDARRMGAARKISLITDFRFHDLRHTTASYLAMEGASAPQIAEILGHKTLQMVKRYSHFNKAHIAEVLTKMNSARLGKENSVSSTNVPEEEE